jgi:DNA-directed RNA polymerase specialized sigma24 family protein
MDPDLVASSIYPALLDQARRLTDSAPDAEDLVQEGFLRWYQGRATFRGAANMRAYIGITMANLAIDRHRAEV